MPFCQNCGAELKNNEKFCSSCGTKVLSVEAASAAGAAAAAAMSQPEPEQTETIQDYYPEQADASQDYYPEQADASQDYYPEQADASQDYYAEQADASQDYYPEQTDAAQQAAAAAEPLPPDVAENKGMAAISYLGVLVLIPLFLRKDSPFARFHINQGLVLMIIELAAMLVKRIANTLLYGMSFAHTVSVICTVVSIVCIILSIIGLVNATGGKFKALPVIGELKILN